ncbi:Methionyl-tRNA formyltransferase [Curvularia kusanoi]|uniref:methionyl-tRNA formyltransferase n=1 Tax=Curvularia kusanoi TaxID=90978 RepID=A0A9P4WDF7_CURKU|nr:Methionyl-tRNA formyltransferase [Curvularia kusanoi]
MQCNLAQRSLHQFVTSLADDPLRILFCGSDRFSIASLDALVHAKHTVPGLIDEIHVAHRPAKPTGRGLKTLKEVPIRAAASALSLPTHTLDTFTGWTPPTSYSLIIAVSFGLLVPPRILNLARHGGLNVHPSLLPDLRGSAPIEHAVLQQRSFTGVSVQTLHPRRFDEGVVLAQTRAPGLAIGEDETADALKERLAQMGAQMLVDVLVERRYVEPLQSAEWYTGATAYAPKITKQDRFVNFEIMDMARVLAVQRALGDMWCLLPNGERLVVHAIVPLNTATLTTGVGQAVMWYDEARKELLFRAACGRVATIKSSTYPGGKAGKGNAKVEKILKEQSKT